jgi:hypothetical protein
MREVIYNILLEFGIPKKLVRLIKMCLMNCAFELYPSSGVSRTNKIEELKI